VIFSKHPPYVFKSKTKKYFCKNLPALGGFKQVDVPTELITVILYKGNIRIFLTTLIESNAMKRLITLIFSAVLLCPMWARAQTTPTIIGTFTWNFNPQLGIQGYPFNFTVSSLPLTITHLGNDQYNVISVGGIAYNDDIGNPYFYGTGLMSLSGTNYKLFLMLIVPIPIYQTVEWATLSCTLNSTTLSGQCSTPSPRGSEVQATFAPK
jgi:hypothetical protein